MQPLILTRHVAHAGYLKVEKLTLRLADGSEVPREVESHGDAAAVLPFDTSRRCALLVRLFRAPVFSITQEVAIEEACAGMIEVESAEATARREAGEEMGVRLDGVEFVCRIWSTPGISTERQSLFLAEYSSSDRVGAGGGVEGEHEGITVIERPLADLAHEFDAGKMVDGKLSILLLALRLRRPELFADA